MKHKVGQVLYILMKKEIKVYPVQVIEEITKRTMEGETTQYVVRVGQSQKTTMLSEIDGDIYESIESIRDIITRKVLSSVENIIETAVQRATAWYKQPEIHSPILSAEERDETRSNDDAIVTLEDGTKARIKLPNIVA